MRKPCGGWHLDVVVVVATRFAFIFHLRTSKILLFVSAPAVLHIGFSLLERDLLIVL